MVVQSVTRIEERTGFKNKKIKKLIMVRYGWEVM